MAEHFERPAELIGNSPAMAGVRARIDRVADSGTSVLVTGPSGSGKDVVARLLHQRGKRAAQPFVAVNCAAVPADLIESEIFGHEAGAFTGAVKMRRGRFELADRGTLFLDEVGDMPAAMQVKLLRVLETFVVERVGGSRGVPVDVRLVAATNLDLDTAIARGKFREDLFYRLAVVEIRMPPLAERREDIAPLLEHFCARMPVTPRFAPAATALLEQLPWRGNVRELRNFVERASALHGDETLDRAAVVTLAGGTRSASMPTGQHSYRRSGDAAPAGDIDLKAILEGVEQEYIERALSASAGAIAESARRLGLRRTTLIEKMRRLNISRAPLH